MVRFEKDKLVIEVPSSYPSFIWVLIMESVINCIRIADKDLIDRNEDCFSGACELLQAMLPGEDAMRKLTERA